MNFPDDIVERLRLLFAKLPPARHAWLSCEARCAGITWHTFFGTCKRAIAVDRRFHTQSARTIARGGTIKRPGGMYFICVPCGGMRRFGNEQAEARG